MNSDLEVFPTAINDALPFAKLSQTGSERVCSVAEMWGNYLWCIWGYNTADILRRINCTSCAHVPGVGSQSLRYVWTQTGDGHDADAQIQALICRPGLLPFCTNQSQIKTSKSNWWTEMEIWTTFDLVCVLPGWVLVSPDSGFWFWSWSLRKRRSNYVLNITDSSVFAERINMTHIYKHIHDI